MRVDRRGPGGAIRVVPDAELQRQGDQDYFQAAIKIPAQQTYASPIDFNRDRGAIEKPHLPTLRVAAPIDAPDGKRFGIMIVNLDMRAALDLLRNAGREGDLFAVNESGDYLVHPDLRREFGFVLGTPFRLQDDFPEFAKLLNSDDTAPRVVEDRTGDRFGIGWNTVKLAGGPRVTILEAVPYSRLFATSTACRASWARWSSRRRPCRWRSSWRDRCRSRWSR